MVESVDNRLLKETNPPPDYYAGYLPQHRKQGTNKFEDTQGSDGAIHTKIVDQNGNPLTGNKANQKDEVLIFDQLPIVDTNVHYYNNDANSIIANFNNYPNRTLMIRNTHDQPVTLSLVSNMRGLNDVLHHSINSDRQEVVIPANGSFAPILIDGVDIPALERIFAYDVSILAKCSIAPTAGDITVKLTMWA